MYQKLNKSIKFYNINTLYIKSHYEKISINIEYLN